MLRPILPQQLAQLMGLKEGAEDHRHPQAQGHVDALAQAKGRKDGQQDQAGAASPILPPRLGVLGQRGVKGPAGEHDPLGRAGGPPGVGDGRRLLPAGLIGGDGPRWGQEFLPGQAVRTLSGLPAADAEFLLDLGREISVQGQDHKVLRRSFPPVFIDLGKGNLQHQDHFGPSLLQIRGHLGGAEFQVHPVGHRPNAVDGIKGGHRLRGAQGNQGYQVPRAHPQPAQAGFGPEDFLKKVLNGDGLVPAAQGNGLLPALHPLPQVLPNGLLHSSRVSLGPPSGLRSGPGPPPLFTAMLLGSMAALRSIRPGTPEAAARLAHWDCM